MDTSSPKKLGAAGENAACQYLMDQGWQIVARNFTCHGASQQKSRCLPAVRSLGHPQAAGRGSGRIIGEIDIVAEKADLLIFVEVKTRRSFAFGSPYEAVTALKQKRLRSLAEFFLIHYRPRFNGRIRFDVMVIMSEPPKFQINHLENAF